VWVVVLALVLGASAAAWWRADQSREVGESVDGVVIGDALDCSNAGCDAIIACATTLRWGASPPPATAAVFGMPSRLRDGTLITRGGPGVSYVVFQLDDGSRHVTTVGVDSC
jgi:hypothetical protein